MQSLNQTESGPLSRATWVHFGRRLFIRRTRGLFLIIYSLWMENEVHGMGRGLCGAQDVGPRSGKIVAGVDASATRQNIYLKFKHPSFGYKIQKRLFRKFQLFDTL